MDQRPKILLVDDEPFNIAVLEQELEDLDFDTDSAADGQEALDKVQQNPPDLVLLDIMMPVMDGFAVLARLKEQPATRDIPVIIISALSDIQNVVKGIQLGAEDYLPKPFDSVLLEARVKACLEKKRLRDKESEYLAQVERLTLAATAVENNTFDPAVIQTVAMRNDALGGLARVFQRMAAEVHAREQRLRQQLAQVAGDQVERQQAQEITITSFVPMDRRQALASGKDLPARTSGAGLFVDVSGFTRLSETLAAEAGPKRGAEELIRHLNEVFSLLIDDVHRFRGSVVSFSGDAMTCWFDGDDGTRAIACGLQLQQSMTQNAEITTSDGTKLSIGIKAAISAGQVWRFLAGAPAIQTFEVLAGKPIDDLAKAEQLARRGQVTIPRGLSEQLGSRVKTAAWHTHLESGVQFGIVTGVEISNPAPAWDELPSGQPADDMARAWVAPAVLERLHATQGEFLADLRPATALFAGFGGIDFARDDHADEKLDQFIRWVQQTLMPHEATLLQITVGDKGSYFYATFGAPDGHDDDPVRALAAALELCSGSARFPFIAEMRIGISTGEMRTGAYGGPGQRTYGVQGAKVNQAAYLMQQAANGIFCDDATRQAAASRFTFETLPPLPGKKGAAPIAVFQPVSATVQAAVGAQLDRVTSSQQLTLKVASVIGREFSFNVLVDIHPIESDKDQIPGHLVAAEKAGLITSHANDGTAKYVFVDSVVLSQTYDRLLFVQRRGLHRAVAEWYEQTSAADLAPVAHIIARHWQEAGEMNRASEYFEIAAALAQERGAVDDAARYLEQSLAINRSGPA